jgi:hypothetical protein
LLSNTIGREAVERAGPLYCENCGYPNAATARFCERCGGILNDPE